MTSLSPQQQEDAVYAASLETSGEILELDVSDERQNRCIAAMHTLAGQIDFDRQLWNLSLAPEATAPDPAAYTMVAAGRAVCDKQVQRHLEQRHRVSRERVHVVLSSSDPQDDLNQLAEQRAATEGDR